MRQKWHHFLNNGANNKYFFGHKLFHFLIVYVFPFIFWENFLSMLRSIFVIGISIACSCTIWIRPTTLLCCLIAASTAKEDVFKSTQNREADQKDQQYKEEEYYKQKFKHNLILSWFINTNTKIRNLVYLLLLKIDKMI